MNKSKLVIYLLLLFIAMCVQSCDDDSEDEPTVNDIQGTWLLTHYFYKYHYIQNDTWRDDIKEEDITTSYWWHDPTGYEPTKYMEHLSFDSRAVHIWLSQFPLPTMPTPSQYDESTPEDLIEYVQAFKDWHEAIGCINDGFPWQCPYLLKGNKLYIGSLYNGDIEFISSDSFTLSYKDSNLEKQGEHKLYIYTFKRNS